MADPQVYAIFNILIAGSLLTEETEATVKRASKSNAVETVAKGYAGESPGAGSTDLSVTNAIPAADIEFDAGDYIDGLLPVEFTAVAFGKQATFKGFIISDSFTSGVNKASTYSFEARGGFTKFV